LAGDLRSLSFADGTFDVVFSQGVLEHFPDPVPAITEQARIVTSNGFLIVDVPQKYNLYTLWKGYLLRQGRWAYGWETQYSPGELKHLGVRCGLQPVGVGSWGDTIAYSFRMRSKLWGFLDHFTQFYFRALNVLVPSLRPYYRQNVTVCFKRDGDRAAMRYGL
jgi:SAM-dependent methyltransferase